MYSHSRVLSHHYLLLASHKHFSRAIASQGQSSSFVRYSCSHSCSPRLNPLIIQQYRCCGQCSVLTRAFGEDSFDLPLLDEWDLDGNSSGYFLSSSDVTAHRLATLGRGRRRHRKKFGIIISFGLIIFSTMLLLYIDWCAWRIVRLPLPPFYMTRPFLISAFLAAFVGYICIPFFQIFEFIQVFKKEGPVRHLLKKSVPTLGGLLFVPIGIFVTRALGGFSSVEVLGAAGATLAFAAIGLLDDIFSLTTKQKRGLPGWAKVLLEAAVGTSFSIWLDISSISSPYGMKMLVPLPLGLVYLGQYYRLLTSFSFVSMGHGVEITNGLDGLASGIAALAFIGMSIAVLPICSGLAIFGASMAGSCVGFLLHNRYKASVYMGDIGSLALGGALASMAACTGMFLPLLISSGVFVVEASSVVIQAIYFSITKGLQRLRRYFLHMAPIHRHLQLSGFGEPTIVAGAYIISSLLALLAGYVGLVSA
ncbi:phospho-N-acetylmuramoyl-pentapeptide-transferase homolog isoform X2 [Prosopis cineraria]|uniref:phospho-N-acetylmuramoyl-pentapeptide- transferase homolog isoform X2 n=1 Tax=Prosopis cineraria TaxID=364024 RepID=UPI00240F8039|nr:phospho-N-acetylmuramoyl-pentapeptide-transferase homolog isoform X2 [Prosopis cineraria]